MKETSLVISTAVTRRSSRRSALRLAYPAWAAEAVLGQDWADVAVVLDRLGGMRCSGARGTGGQGEQAPWKPKPHRGTGHRSPSWISSGGIYDSDVSGHGVAQLAPGRDPLTIQQRGVQPQAQGYGRVAGAE